MTRAEWLNDWLRFKSEAERFGSKDPGQVADTLAGPAPAGAAVYVVVKPSIAWPGRWEVVCRIDGDFKDVLLARTRTREEAEALAARERG